VRPIGAASLSLCVLGLGLVSYWTPAAGTSSAADRHKADSLESAPPTVELTPVPGPERWADAIEEGALNLACAASAAELGAFFAREGLPFEADLVRNRGGRVCHVHYRPTVPGFRASPDEDRLTEILFDADALLYLATAGENRGDVLGALTEVLTRVPRRLEVGVFTRRVHAEAAYERATRRSFGGTPHHVTLLDRGVDRSFWWVQDYVKGGRSDRGGTILIPRRIFEGDPRNGELYGPLLDQISAQNRVTRSRLSWEGGDLQFTLDPRDPTRLILYYGDFVKPYWGESLTGNEFEYVLRLEFGADRTVDLGGLAPHVDYIVCFLARENVALVSVARSGDLDVARAALESLRARFAGGEPPTLQELGEALASPHPDPGEVAGLVAQARRRQGEFAARTEEKIAGLEEMGFRVIRVPAFRVNLRKERSWPGISYVNALVVDKQVFVPRFGLGEVEDGILRRLDTKLPSGYSVVPVYAQRVLIRNGGLHCLAGLVRSAGE
jgi:hypothetical protein